MGPSVEITPRRSKYLFVLWLCIAAHEILTGSVGSVRYKRWHWTTEHIFGNEISATDETQTLDRSPSDRKFHRFSFDWCAPVDDPIKVEMPDFSRWYALNCFRCLGYMHSVLNLSQFFRLNAVWRHFCDAVTLFFCRYDKSLCITKCKIYKNVKSSAIVIILL